MFDDLVAGTTGAAGASAVDAWTRVESAACARRLAAMVALLDAAHAADGSADREQWCLDNWAAVCAHIGAAQRLTPGATSGLLLTGVALQERLPKVAAVFADGLIGYPLVRTIVWRSMLVDDTHAQRLLDTALAAALTGWEPMSQDKTEAAIDTFIHRFDPHAVRRTHSSARSRSVDVVINDATGTAELFGTLFATDAVAVDGRLTALAATTCAADPRTIDQRRADALGALAHGADRLPCLCESPDCVAALNPPSTGVIIHLIAHHDTLTAPPTHPAPPAPDVPTPTDEPTTPDEGDSPDEQIFDEERDLGGEPVGGSCDGPHPDPEAFTTDSTPTDCTPTDCTPTDCTPVDECAGLDGNPPPMFTKPLREMTLREVMAPRPGQFSTIRPAALAGAGFLPGPVARRAALGATIRAIVHPGQAPPEPRYTPSRKLADFVRCRDLTCRFPGCTEPAINCDLDHTIPWPQGPTSASNLASLCRKHHLLKTFWAGRGGWRNRQHPDGTIVWTAPDGRTHNTTPGSRLLFPELSAPTAAIAPTTETVTPATGLTMPRRRTTRKHDRSYRIHTERELNRVAIEQRPPEPPPPF